MPCVRGALRPFRWRGFGPTLTAWNEEVGVGDVIFGLVGAVSFALLLLFVRGVDRL